MGEKCKMKGKFLNGWVLLMFEKSKKIAGYFELTVDSDWEISI